MATSMGRESHVTWVQAPAKHMLLWIDAVGGYLVCLGRRWTIGQVNLEAMPDIAVLADISRHHATLQRDAEGYSVEAIRKLKVNGQPVERALLRDGDRLTLGSACQMVFTQPVPVSASACLQVVSGHRLHRPVEGVLLMAETVVLAAAQAHVVIDELEQPVVIHRQGERLAVRCAGPLAIDGEAVKERGVVRPGQRVAAGSLTFTLDAL